MFGVHQAGSVYLRTRYQYSTAISSSFRWRGRRGRALVIITGGATAQRLGAAAAPGRDILTAGAGEPADEASPSPRMELLAACYRLAMLRRRARAVVTRDFDSPVGSAAEGQTAPGPFVLRRRLPMTSRTGASRQWRRAWQADSGAWEWWPLFTVSRPPQRQSGI